MSLGEIVRDRLAASDLDGSQRSVVEAAVKAVAVDSTTGSAMRSEVLLTSLSVEGFRGIGRKVSVSLHPGVGLMVITGRNGSGKSSLAESIELLPTGDNARWADRKNKTDLGRGLREAGGRQAADLCRVLPAERPRPGGRREVGPRRPGPESARVCDHATVPVL